MSIIQKNIFGDNIVYNMSPNFTRQLPIELQNDLISTLNSWYVSSISIRFEYSSETAQYVAHVAAGSKDQLK